MNEFNLHNLHELILIEKTVRFKKKNNYFTQKKLRSQPLGRLAWGKTSTKTFGCVFAKSSTRVWIFFYVIFYKNSPEAIFCLFWTSDSLQYIYLYILSRLDCWKKMRTSIQKRNGRKERLSKRSMILIRKPVQVAY